MTTTASTFSYRDLLIVLGAVIVFSLSCIFVRGWMLERDARVKAEATAAAKQQIVEAQQKVIDSAQDDIVARDQASAQKDSTIAALEATLHTPQQAVKIITQQVPAAAAASPVVVDTSSLPTADQKQLPNDPSTVLVPGSTFTAMGQKLLTCVQTENDAATCKADLVDTQTKFAASQTQLAAKTAESDTWETAAKGGTKFHRFLGVVKQTACAAVGSAGGAALAKSRPAEGAAIGAIVGGVACALLP